MLAKINYPGTDKSSDFHIKNIAKACGTDLSNLAEILYNKVRTMEFCL